MKRASSALRVMKSGPHNTLYNMFYVSAGAPSANIIDRARRDYERYGAQGIADSPEMLRRWKYAVQRDREKQGK